MLNQTAVQVDTERSTATDYDQYAIASRIEISQLLHAIMRQTTLITASVGSDDFFLTTLVAIDDDADCLLLECGRHSEQAQRVLKKQRLARGQPRSGIHLRAAIRTRAADKFDLRLVRLVRPV